MNKKQKQIEEKTIDHLPPTPYHLPHFIFPILETLDALDQGKQAFTQPNLHTDTQTDIATYILNQPRG